MRPKNKSTPRDTPADHRRPGRPVDQDKQARIVAAAWELFLAHGVQAVPMETVASRAGVSKVTVYRYFPDRQALLEAGVLAEMERIEAAQRTSPAPSGHDADLAVRLQQFGTGLMQFLAGANAVAFYASLAGELSRHPDLARRFWDAGPGRTRHNLVQLINQANQNGELHVPDVELAAEQLFGLWQGFTNLQYALGIPDTTGLDRRVEAGVQMFLDIYRPRSWPRSVRRSTSGTPLGQPCQRISPSTMLVVAVNPTARATPLDE